MKPLFFLCVITLLTLTLKIAAEDSLLIFYDNQFPLNAFNQEIDEGVLTDVELIESYNIDEKDNATRQINVAVEKIVKNSGYRRGSNVDVKKVYQSGFSELINNEVLWLPIYHALEKGGKTLSLMIRYNIKKVPAYVFNEKDIVYGVNSIEEALAIFRAADITDGVVKSGGED